MVAATVRTVFAQPDAGHVRSQLDEVTRMLEGQFPDVATMLRDATEDLLAFTSFPLGHWRKIWSTNPLERLNGEIKRRSKVVGIFPNDASIARLVTAVVVETHDEWAVAEHLPLRRLHGQSPHHRAADQRHRTTRHHRIDQLSERQAPTPAPIYTTPRDATQIGPS